MTWTKLGSEFFRECFHHGLSDASVRTHGEAIEYLYTCEEMSLRIPKRAVRSFAGSEDATQAVEDLVALEWWADRGTHWEVIHHADVIRQSLAAQQKQRATSKKTSAKYRQKKTEQPESSSDGTTEVTRHVTPNADRQTDKQLERRGSTACVHGQANGAVVDPWSHKCVCSLCEENRRRTA